MGELVPEAPHQSIQEKLMASEAAETSAAATQAGVKTPGEAMKEKVKPSEAEERGEDAGGMCGLTERAAKAGSDCCVPKSARKTANLAPEDRESKVEGEELHNKGP